MNQRYVLTTVKLKDLLSLFVIGLHKVQTQNLLFTLTWNVKRAQNNFVPIFNSKVGVRLIHKCDLYSSKYGNHFWIWDLIMVALWQVQFLPPILMGGGSIAVGEDKRSNFPTKNLYRLCFCNLRQV